MRELFNIAGIYNIIGVIVTAVLIFISLITKNQLVAVFAIMSIWLAGQPWDSIFERNNTRPLFKK